MYKEERYTVEEEMREIEECDVEEFFVHQNSSEKTIAMLGDRWWPQAAKPEGDKNRKKNAMYGNKVMSAQLLEMSLLGIGTVLRPEMDVWSMVK